MVEPGIWRTGKPALTSGASADRVQRAIAENEIGRGGQKLEANDMPAVAVQLSALRAKSDATLGWARASLCDAIAGGGRGTQLRDLEALAHGHALLAAGDLAALSAQADGTLAPEVRARLQNEFYVPQAPNKNVLGAALRTLRAEYNDANRRDPRQARQVLAAARNAGLTEQVLPRTEDELNMEVAQLLQGAERMPDRGAALTRAAESADAFRWIAALHSSEWPTQTLAQTPGFPGFERIVRTTWGQQTGKSGWTARALGRDIAAGFLPEPRGPRIRDALRSHPTISCLADAPSNAREPGGTERYERNSGEELRSAKSILLRHHFSAGDWKAITGSSGAEMEDGLRTYTAIVTAGLHELGDGDIDLGGARMDLILEVHDIAKSAAAAAAVEQHYGVTDHDMALPALVADNFSALKGVVPDSILQRLRTVVAADPKVRAFLGEQRGIRPTFNIGRHLRGEADFTLFNQTVSDVSAVSMAEFVLDLLGSDGHVAPDGPARFSNIPAAFNGIAAGLEKLQTATHRNAAPDLYRVWEDLSYPAADLARLGLTRDSDENTAITRIAFMGSEHQHPDEAAAQSNIAGLRSAFDTLTPAAWQQITQMLGDRAALDLGFAPHVLESMRKVVDSGAAYSTFLSILNQLNDLTPQHDRQDVTTVNLDYKRSWEELTANSAVGVALDGPDSAGVFRATFTVSP